MVKGLTDNMLTSSKFNCHILSKSNLKEVDTCDHMVSCDKMFPLSEYVWMFVVEIFNAK